MWDTAASFHVLLPLDLLQQKWGETGIDIRYMNPTLDTPYLTLSVTIRTGLGTDELRWSSGSPDLMTNISWFHQLPPLVSKSDTNIFSRHSIDVDKDRPLGKTAALVDVDKDGPLSEGFF